MIISRLVLSFLGLAGIAMLAGSVWLSNDTREFVASAEVADGKVVELNYQSSSDGGAYYPVVRFKPVGGVEIEFESGLGSSPASYDRGESVSVLYDPSDPDNAEINSFMALWFAPIVVGFMGTVFSAIGGGGCLAIFVAWRRRVWLDQNGQRVNAEVVDVSTDPSRRRARWQITAQWEDPMRGEVHTFESEQLSFDPSPYLAGKWVPMLIDPQNPKRYLFDLSFLPKHE